MEKWLKGLNIRHDTIKLLEENTGKKLSDIDCTNVFLGLSPKAIEIKTKISKWNLCVIGWGIVLEYRDIEWFALKMNRDPSVVFEIASKYCISDSFVYYDGYSISSKGFLPTVVDIMVI